MGNFKDVCRYRAVVIMVYDDKITHILYIELVDAKDACSGPLRERSIS